MGSSVLRGWQNLFSFTMAAVMAQMVVTTSARLLRGELVELEDGLGMPRLLQGATCVPRNLPWWFYLTMPFISGIVGWGTNKVALKMTFYPYNFWGIELVRFKDQPVGLFGWQGIVPTKAGKMASDSVDLMTTKLFNMKEIFSRIEKDKAAVYLKKGFETTLNRLVDDLSDKYIIEKTTQWKRTEGAIKSQLTDWALNELPSFTAAFMGDLIENLDDVYDLKHMCVTEMESNPDLLVGVFTSVGAKELLFIERSGFYFGFLFGSIQVLLFRFAIPSPISDYLLPFLGFLVGYVTNWIALKLIFQPIEPHKILGGRFTIQGLFLKRQQEASAKFAAKMVASVLHSRNIWTYLMIKGPKANEFEKLLRRHTSDFTDRMVGFSGPLIQAYMGGQDQFEKMRVDVEDMAVNEIFNVVTWMHDYTDAALDLETEIREKMQALPSKEFEQVLHPVFEEDEFKLILVGAFLGIVVGMLQMFASFAIQGCFPWDS